MSFSMMALSVVRETAKRDARRFCVEHLKQLNYYLKTIRDYYENADEIVIQYLIHYFFSIKT